MLGPVQLNTWAEDIKMIYERYLEYSCKGPQAHLRQGLMAHKLFEWNTWMSVVFDI